jgi:asparagine synthetase A
MKVYIISKGEYSDYHICAVTLDEQEAERLAKIYTDSWDYAIVEEWDTDEHKDLLNGRVPYVVKFYKVTSRTIVDRYTGSPGNFKPGVFLSASFDEVKLFAMDSEAAVKIAAEKRAQALAEREGIV